MASNSVSKQSETSKMASLRSKPRKIRTVIKYKECMRNHAASMGGHAVDGCCEFTARDDHDQDLLCEACGCHRNFHRKEMIHNGVPMNITSRYVAPTTTSVLLIGPNNCHEYLWTGEERKVIVLRPTPHPPPGFSKIHHPDQHHHYNYEHRVLYGHDHHEVELAGKKPNLTKKPKMEL